MSAPSYWLQRQRKSDLQNLADQVGLKDYENLKKTELESALDEHMRANRTRLSQDPSYDPFYKRVHPTASPLKKSALALIPPATAAVETPQGKKPRQRRSLIKPRDEPDPPPLSDTSSPRPRTPRALLSLSLPPSPSLVADQIAAQTASLRSQLSALFSRTRLVPLAHALRAAFASVSVIHLLALLLELAFVVADVLPLKYVGEIPGWEGLGLGLGLGWESSIRVRVPDLFALLELDGFWGPVGAWVVWGVGVPVVGGWVFDLRETGGEGRGGGVDPLAFAVVRGLVVWGVYGGGSGGEWVRRVEGSVLGGWKGMGVGAAVGGVMSLYEAVLRK